MKKQVFMILIFFVFFFSCSNSSPDEYEENPGQGGTMEIASDLFIPDESTGIIEFETNDLAYWSENGYTLWFPLEEEDPAFSSREVVVSKLSGSSTAGYGLVYCYQGDEYNYSMLVVLVNTQKEYVVAESSSDDPWNVFIPWTESQALKSGYNQGNSIRLEYNSAEEEYLLYLNDVETASFRDDEEPYHTSGQHGYVVVISPLDDFPDIPVRVQFQEIN